MPPEPSDEHLGQMLRYAMEESGMRGWGGERALLVTEDASWPGWPMFHRTGLWVDRPAATALQLACEVISRQKCEIDYLRRQLEATKP